MSLTHESVIRDGAAYAPGDMKLVGYNIVFTANQLVTPAQDPGWFLLNGAVISQATYPILYSYYGTTFNTGSEGVGNFRLPDFTDGKLPLPKGLTNFTTYGATTDPGINSPGHNGEITHTLTSAELLAHSHTDNFQVSVGSHSHNGSASINAADGSHTHLAYYISAANVGGTSGGTTNVAEVGITSTTTNATTHSHSALTTVNSATSPNLTVGGSINSTGSGTAHNNMQPYQILGGWLVKVG